MSWKHKAVLSLIPPGFGHSFRNLLFSSSEHTNKGWTLFFPTLLLVSCVVSALQFPLCSFPSCGRRFEWQSCPGPSAQLEQRGCPESPGAQWNSQPGSPRAIPACACRALPAPAAMLSIRGLPKPHARFLWLKWLPRY